MESIKQNAIEQIKQGIETLERRLTKRENAEWAERLEQYKVGLAWLENNNDPKFWSEMRGQDFQGVAIVIATKTFDEYFLPATAQRLFSDLL